MAGDESEPMKALYSSLDSTLSPAAIIELAERHGLSSVALTGIGNLHEAVEFLESAKKEGVKPIFGDEVRVGDHPRLPPGLQESGLLQIKSGGPVWLTNEERHSPWRPKRVAQ
jgi:DNA polymerase III alpha subunit